MVFIVQFILSFFASFSFGIIFNIPRRHLVSSGITGAFGWVMFYLLNQTIGIDDLIANFVAAIMMTSTAIFFTKRLQAPLIVFVTCGLIPLVPGGKAYEAVRAVVENNYLESLETGFQAALISLSIAMGIIITEMIYELFKNIKKRITEIWN